MFSLSGELNIVTSRIPVNSTEPEIKTSDMVLDSYNQLFTKASIVVETQGVRTVHFMDAMQVELILKIIRACKGGYKSNEKGDYAENDS